MGGYAIGGAGNAVGIDVLAAEDCQLVASDQDLDLFGVRRPPTEHHQLEKAAQRQVDKRPHHQHLQRDGSTRPRTISLRPHPRCSGVHPTSGTPRAQRGADRGRGDAHAKPLELAFDPLVAPGRVLPGQADDQPLHRWVQRRPAGVAVRVGPCPGDQPPMPAQQRLGLDEQARPPGSGQHALTAASRARSAGSSLGHGVWRRRTRISRSLAASPRASRASSWMERHSVR
jgi:hypothetical protein